MLKRMAFQKLSIVQQMMQIMDSGYTLLVRKEGPINIKLFELDGFFVEVRYNSVENRIVSVEVVELNDVTDDYLSNIEIENIF